MRFLLESIWAAMGQPWAKQLSAEHSKLFSDWYSELREIRTMSVNRLYFENGCSNLRLHIFTDASEQAMSSVAYLQDEATLRLTYVVGKCRVSPIRHTTITKLEFQAAIYCLLPTGQRKRWINGSKETLPWINGEMSKELKTLQILAQVGCQSKTSSTPGG